MCRSLSLNKALITYKVFSLINFLLETLNIINKSFSTKFCICQMTSIIWVISSLPFMSKTSIYREVRSSSASRRNLFKFRFLTCYVNCLKWWDILDLYTLKYQNITNTTSLRTDLTKYTQEEIVSESRSHIFLNSHMVDHKVLFKIELAYFFWCTKENKLLILDLEQISKEFYSAWRLN
jgi:hypothetical protein